ncbi:response regulator [Asticcacaulis solisilvae]|uniref:response regulator n=1 Tax=Asticcacaulis solisilvae TaxID=1217274 RepID=UPI003FD83974
MADDSLSPTEVLPTVLVVDDTEDMRELVQAGLSRRGFTVLMADGGVAMDAILADTAVDLIVLDSMMPGESGPNICARVSHAGGPPIIMLSASAGDQARIQGLNLGAEDYMAKPFNMDELAVRIRIVLRRAPARSAEVPDTVRFFGWTLDNKTRRLTSPADKVLALSSAEFALLHVFLSQRDRPLRREQLLDRMADLHDFSTERSLDTLISRFRKKLDYVAPEGDQPLIQTVYGVGYMFRPN